MSAEPKKLGAPVPQHIIDAITAYGDQRADGGLGSAVKLAEVILAMRRHYRAPSHTASTEPVSNFTATQAAQLTEQDAKYAERYRWPREQRGIKGDFPMDGDCWVVQLSQPKGAMPDLRCAGFGDKLDTTIDAAILANQSQKG